MVAFAPKIIISAVLKPGTKPGHSDFEFTAFTRPEMLARFLDGCNDEMIVCALSLSALSGVKFNWPDHDEVIKIAEEFEKLLNDFAIVEPVRVFLLFKQTENTATLSFFNNHCNVFLHSWKWIR